LPVEVAIYGLPQGITSSPATPFSVAAGSGQQLTFAAPAAAGTFMVTLLATSGELSHSATLTLTITPKPNPFLVVASYYPWYVQSSWDYLECYEGTLRGELIPAQWPALGRYNSQTEDVITQQIAWSAAGGVNVWDMEWIMPNDFQDNTFRNQILTNPHVADMRFAIMYDYAIRFAADFNLTPAKIDTILSDFNYFSQAYFNHPSYLKVDGNRPVVFIYATRAFWPVSAVQDMVAALRKAMSDLGYDVYLIGDEYYALTPPDPVRISLWDGIFGYDAYCGYYGYADENGYFALHQKMEDQYQAVAQQYGVDFVPSVMPGFNDRAVRRVCANNRALARRENAGAPEGSMFSRILGEIALPHAMNSRNKMVHITSFNEWHEDTEIEPSIITTYTTGDTSPSGFQYTQGLVYEGFGTTYLDIIRNQISAAVGLSQPARQYQAAVRNRAHHPRKSNSTYGLIHAWRAPSELGLRPFHTFQGDCRKP
jgi:glycoprotein endo-alpha-1,2-mannosidase